MSVAMPSHIQTLMAMRSSTARRLLSFHLHRPSHCAPFSFSAATHHQKLSDPLRILFCGSDEFSIAALEALHKEKQSNPTLVETLDVVVRPGKPTGRGLKNIRQVPLKSTALQLGLPIHELNTFTGWTPSFDFNLIIAVSFGLLVPPRLLRLAKYGGLNLHPSLLPDLRGPAPLHHTLLQNRRHTGITLQTLHESKFDHGTILAQTPSPPGIPVPVGADLPTLHRLVTPPAAEMLLQGLRAGLHVPPLQPPAAAAAAAAGWSSSDALDNDHHIRHAPKLGKEDRRACWGEWSAQDFAVRCRVLGPLWGHVRVPGMEGSLKRLIIEDVAVASGEASPFSDASPRRTVTWVDGQDRTDVEVQYVESGEGDGSVFMRISAEDGGIIRVRSIKVEGEKSKPAARALSTLSREVADAA